MAADCLKEKIHQELKKGLFNDEQDLIDISDGTNGNVHLVIVSRKFDGRRLKEKNDLIWSELTQHLAPEEWGHISLSVGVSPEEIKAY
jgi:stress-induced morphogen